MGASKDGGGKAFDGRFLYLAAQVIFMHTLSANCHERIFVSGGGFNLPIFLTLLEFTSHTCVMGIKRVLHGSQLWGGFTPLHLTCALCMLGTHGSSNAALVHLNYTTNTLFKSSKVFFVMIGGWFVHGRRVSATQWVAAACLFSGLAAFGLADRMSSPRFTVLGVCLTLTSLLGGSYSGNLQQKAAQLTGDGKTKTERKDDLLFWQYLIGSLCCLVLAAATGELAQGVTFLRGASAAQLLNIGGFMWAGFAGINPLLCLVQEYDATSATVVTSLRKVVTFTSSFLFFPKPFTLLHAGSAFLAVGGAYALQRLRDSAPHGTKLVGLHKRGSPQREDANGGHRYNTRHRANAH